MSQHSRATTAMARAALARATTACRAFLLVAPVSLADATAAAAAAMQGNPSPFGLAVKHPVAFWAAASAITAARAAPAWTEAARFVHATTPAGAAALAHYIAADDFRDQLDALYAAALAVEPPEFVCRAIATRTPLDTAAACAVLTEVFLRGSPSPRIMFAAYAGLATAVCTHVAGPPAIAHTGAYEGGDNASDRVLRFCTPVVFNAPRCIDDIYQLAFNAAGSECDRAIADGRWQAAHLMREFLLRLDDPLDLAALPVAAPSEVRYDVDEGLVAADGRANAWAMYNYAAQLDHTGIWPAHGPHLSKALCVCFRRMDFARVRWVRAETFAQIIDATDHNRCAVLHEGTSWIEAPGP